MKEPRLSKYQLAVLQFMANGNDIVEVSGCSYFPGNVVVDRRTTQILLEARLIHRVTTISSIGRRLLTCRRKKARGSKR